MIDSKLKVLFIYSDRECLCTFKRTFEIVLGLFRYYKDEVSAQMIFFENLDASTFHSFDVVVFQRLGANGGILTQKFRKNLEQWIKRHRNHCFFIYEIDDFLFDRQKSTPIWLAQLCHLALVPTDTLANEMSRFQICRIIRTHVDIESIEKVKPINLGVSENFKIGWFSSCAKGIDLIKPVLRKLQDSNVQLYLFCSRVYHEQIKTSLHYENLHLYPTVSAIEMYGYLKSMDCLINPLSTHPDHQSTLSLQSDQLEKLLQSKAEIKYALAGAVKLPLIVTPNDAYKVAIQDSVNGFFAASTQEWVDKILFLSNNQQAAKKIGELAYKDVQIRYSLKRAAKDYKELFTDSALLARVS